MFLYGLVFLPIVLLGTISVFSSSTVDECIMCNDITTQVETLLQTPTIIKDVQVLIKKDICSKLSSFEYQVVCGVFVSELPSLFSQLKTTYPSAVMCKDLKMC